MSVLESLYRISNSIDEQEDSKSFPLLTPIDNATLRGRGKRKFEDTEEKDYNSEIYKNPESFNSSNKSINWRYVPIEKVLKGDQAEEADENEDEIYSSCDEGEEEDEEEYTGDQETKRKRVKDKRCFGCSWGSSGTGDSINGNKMNVCIKIIEQNYGKTDNAELARIVHCFYMKEIYEPLKKEGKSIPKWTSKKIKKHIESHLLEPRIFIGESLKKLSRFERLLENMIVTEHEFIDGSRRMLLMEKNMKLSLEIMKRKLELYKATPRSMNFFNSDCSINMEMIGKFVNIQKEWNWSAIE